MFSAVLNISSLGCLSDLCFIEWSCFLINHHALSAFLTNVTYHYELLIDGHDLSQFEWVFVVYQIDRSVERYFFFTESLIKLVRFLN